MHGRLEPDPTEKRGRLSYYNRSTIHQILRGGDLGLQAGEEAAPPCGLGLIGAGDGAGGAAFAQE